MVYLPRLTLKGAVMRNIHATMGVVPRTWVLEVRRSCTLSHTGHPKQVVRLNLSCYFTGSFLTPSLLFLAQKTVLKYGHASGQSCVPWHGTHFNYANLTLIGRLLVAEVYICSESFFKNIISEILRMERTWRSFVIYHW